MPPAAAETERKMNEQKPWWHGAIVASPFFTLALVDFIARQYVDWQTLRWLNWVMLALAIGASFLLTRRDPQPPLGRRARNVLLSAFVAMLVVFGVVIFAT